VDDSTDGTVERLEHLAEMDPHVRYEHRVGDRGLGTAVVLGFQLARGTVLAVMDANLQHPPEMLPKMLAEIENRADIVIPSRFIPGGSDGGLNIFRKIVSATARYMGKIALKSLRPISDPTGGFFMFRQSVIEGVELRPVGWKILIEILVRGNYRTVAEIPYGFMARAAGESKMSLKEQWTYICHLIRLASENPKERRFYAFSLIGLSGVFVNMLVYYAMVHMGIIIALAGTSSAVLAMIFNFVLNDSITFGDIRTSPKLERFIKYVITSSAGIAINIVSLSLLYYLFKLNYMVANLVGIAAGFIWNYTVNTIWTWRAEPGMSPSIDVLRSPIERDLNS
jgi:dolichol-phosphate mannosyltransferase